MLGDGVGDDFAVLCHGVHLHLLGVLDELAHHHGVFLRYVGRQLEEALQLFLVGADVHGGAAQHVAGADEHGETYLLDESVDVFHRRQRAPLGLVYTDAVEHGRELVAVFGIVDALGRGAEDTDLLRVETQGQVVRYLTAGRDDDAVRVLQVEDVHDTLEGELVEVEAVAHVVVGGDGLGIIVNHHTAVALLADGVQGLHAAPVELHAGADAVGARTEDDDAAVVAQVADVVGRAAVRQVQVVGLRRIFGGQRVYLLHHGHDTTFLAVAAQSDDGVFHLALHADGAGHLEVGEALTLGLAQQVVRQVGQELVVARPFVQFLGGAHDVHQLLQEPAIYLGQLVYLVYGVAGTEGFRDDENTFIGRLAQGLVYVENDEFLVLYKAVHALAYHTQAFLNGFLEGAADGHDLAHGLHRRTQFLVYAVKLAEVPARYLAHHVVQRGLEEGRGSLGNGVLQVEQSVAQAQLGGHKCQRIAGSFRRQSRRAAKAGIDLDDAVVLGLRVVGILHVTLAHDADVADDADGQLAQLVVVGVRERLAGGDDDALACVDAQRVEVLHVADGDAVVEAVAHHLVLHFLPAAEALLDEHLGREGEGLLDQHVQFLLVVAEARTQSAQGIGGTDDDRIAQLAGGATGVFGVLDGLALDGLHVDFVQFLHEEFAVFGVDDGLHGGAQHLHVVLLEHAFLVEGHAAVQCRLPAKGQHDAVRPLLLDDLLNEVGGDRQEVNLVGHTLRGLHGGDVGVDEDGLDALFLEGLECLRTGVVELAGLADLQRAASEQQDFSYVVLFHCVYTIYKKDYLSRFTNSSKRNSVSVGPEAASGWNWAENQGLRL